MLSAQARALLQLVDGTLAEQQRRATAAAPPHAPYECLCPLELVHEVAFELQVLAERKGLALSVSASPAAEAARVKVERTKVAQILRNLISNAIKFTQHGFVAVNLDVHDGQLFVAVRDSGVGMSAEAIDRLFERYAPGSHPQSGSGLGLWIALERARRLGGMVLVESQPGAGSCFTLRLPLAPRVSP
jgi:signal transduction histidine kinase